VIKRVAARVKPERDVRAFRECAAGARAVVLHGLDHLVDLAHVDESTQIMYPESASRSPRTPPATWPASPRSAPDPAPRGSSQPDRVRPVRDPQTASYEQCVVNAQVLIAFCRRLRLPLGVNVESLTNRKVEIDASIDLTLEIRSLLD